MPHDPAASDFLVSPMTSMPNPASLLLGPPEPTGHMGFNHDDVSYADLDAMDSFFSAASMSMVSPDISPPAGQPPFHQDFDFNSSSSSSGTSPSSSASVNRPAQLRTGSEVTIPNTTDLSSSQQDQQQSLIPYDGANSADTARSRSMPPPRDQALYESRPEKTLRILSTASPAEALDGWLSTLHIAAQKGHDSIVRTLLQHGNLDCNERDSDGQTPLMHAVTGGHEAVVRLLLAHGARISEVDRDRRSALHLAVMHRRERVLRILLEQREQGLSIDGYDVAGWTPLHMAVDRDFEAGMVLLVQSGANLHSKARKCPFAGKDTS
jgi:hypothetical protein